MFVDGKTPANQSVKLGTYTQVDEISSMCHFSSFVSHKLNISYPTSFYMIVNLWAQITNWKTVGKSIFSPFSKNLL